MVLEKHPWLDYVCELRREEEGYKRNFEIGPILNLGLAPFAKDLVGKHSVCLVVSLMFRI